jgi:chitinase/chitodextrinase
MKNTLTNPLNVSWQLQLRRNRFLAFLFILIAFASSFAQAQTACSAAWVAATAYTGGAQVSRSGNNYTAKWWTQGEDPVTASCTDCAWRLVGPCGTGTTNTAPTVGLTAPASGASYTAPATIAISANATDNVSVAKVEFYSGTTKLGEDLSAPYTYSWTGVTAGTYSITAKATDNAGLTATSAAVSVTVGTAQTGAAIPGTIQAEAYTAMSGVQLETTTDTGGGQNVGYIDAGDWMDYAVNVSTAGSYTLSFRVASLNGGGQVQLRNSAGTSLGGVTVGATGGWQTWATLTTTVTLPAGAQTLRVYAVTGGFNLNYLTFATGSTAPTNTPPTVSFTSPASGASFSAPASISLAASASDNVSVAKVEFFSGSTLLFSDATAPYSYTWTNVAAGTYTITAKATDNAGLTSSVSQSFTVTGGTTNPTSGLPKHIMSGYLHTWNGGVPFIKLRDVNAAWDVINISFAEPVAAGSTDGRMKFVVAGLTPDYTITDFKADIKTLQGRGKKIVLSIGGYEGYFSLGSAAAVTQFVTDIKAIVNEYGFDGIDIDLEQSSVQFNSGADPDFTNPTSPKVVNMISAIRQVVSAYPSTFILSWAPETFYFQMGHQWYGGTNAYVDARSGVYIPMIHALRDRTTYVQAQLYNSAQMQGNDGVMYTMGTVEGIAAMTEMVIQGFTIGSATGPLFPGLRPDQVVIGVPSSQGAAGSGQVSNADLQAAFSRVNNKYPGLRGIMSWSINWDAYQNANSFVTSNATYLKGLANRGVLASSTKAGATGPSVYPNPVLAGNRLALELGASYQIVQVVITDLTGRKVGTYSFRNVHTADLTMPARAKGMLLLRITADGHTFTQKLLAE